MQSALKKFSLFAWLVFLFCLNVPVWADLQPIPELKQRVTDVTATLTQDEIADLREQLATLESSKGSQLAVLIVPTTLPETIEAYSLRVAEKWKLGRKGIDDGVLLLIALQDRAIRIEVGYGLEGAIPDVTASRVIAEYMTPLFRLNDYYGGIREGVVGLIALINGEPLPPSEWTEYGEAEQGPLDLLFFSVFVLGFANFLSSFFGRVIAASLAGGIVGLLAFSLGYALAIYIGIGVLVFIAGLILMGGRGSSYRDGGGFGGGFGSGGGSNSGGFGGGGGGFGGGGASGGW